MTFDGCCRAKLILALFNKKTPSLRGLQEIILNWVTAMADFPITKMIVLIVNILVNNVSIRYRLSGVFFFMCYIIFIMLIIVLRNNDRVGDICWTPEVERFCLGGGQARRSKFSFRNNILRLVFFCNGFDNTVIISTLLRGVCDIHSRQYLFRRRVVVVRHGIKYPINPCTQCSVSFWRQGGIHVLKTRVLHRQAVVEYEIRQDRVCVLKSCCVHYFFFFFTYKSMTIKLKSESWTTNLVCGSWFTGVLWAVV